MLLNCFFYIVSAKGKIHKKENDNKKYLPALRLYLRQYRIILSADTASKVRQMLSQKRR